MPDGLASAALRGSQRTRAADPCSRQTPAVEAHCPANFFNPIFWRLAPIYLTRGARIALKQYLFNLIYIDFTIK